LLGVEEAIAQFLDRQRLRVLAGLPARVQVVLLLIPFQGTVGIVPPAESGELAA
jgi:hypothetical protein